MGASASVNLRIPLGTVNNENDEVRYDLTMAYGQHVERSGQPLQLGDVRSVELAQINFDRRGARDMQVANFGVSDFGREDIEGQRNLVGGGTTYIMLGAMILGVVVALSLAGDGTE